MSSSRMVIDEAVCTYISKYLLKDLYYCLDYAAELKSKTELLLNDPENGDLKQWLKKREALQEKVQKILVNAKEEWRVVLQIAPEIMRICLDLLERCPPRSDLFDMSLDFLRSLSLCINPKRIGRYWPTEVRWLPLVTNWVELYLKDYSPQDFSSTNILILWLASAVKTPFDLSRFDMHGDNPLATRIANIIDDNVANYALLPVVQLLAGSYYSRPDCCAWLSQFIPKLSSTLMDSSKSVNSKLCCLRIMATLLKSVDRSTMLKHVDGMVQVALKSLESDHEHCVKMSMKICGRSALVHLKPREFKWRYRCGKRVIQLAPENQTKPAPATNDNPASDDAAAEEEEDLDLPEYFETLIQTLLQNLVHKSTVVRFSVAKYLACIGSRLPYEYSDQILTNVFDLCQPMEDDQYWHGACLALAEFVRRSYVQMDAMSRVIEILDHGLTFEQIKGSYSAGANVRDAACYICWSMARAYDGQLIADYVAHLAPILLNVACFDREVNCRRAASAVIQELAGRTQKFPHWTDVIPRLEFHELSNIEHTYLEIGVHFGRTYEEFFPALAENLLAQKAIHWDASIRRLAAKTLARMVCSRSLYGREQFDQFFETFDHLDQMDLIHRHGRFLAISHILGSDPSLQKQTSVISQVYKLFDHQISNLASGNTNAFESNLMRESLLVMSEKCLALWREHLPDGDSVLNNVRTFLLNTVRCNESNELIQSTAIDALIHFMSFDDQKDGSTLLSDLIALIRNHDPFIVSTVVQFLFRFYPQIDSTEMVERILTALNAYLDRWFGEELRRPETIADISKTLLKMSAHFYGKISESLRQEIQRKVLKCLDDHSITKKGDTGQPVRRETIEHIYDYARKVSADDLLPIIQLLASEAAFRRDRTFLSTMTQLRRLSRHILQDERLQSLKALNMEKILSLDPICSEDLDLYQECIHLFECSPLVSDLWRGFVCVLADPIMDKHSKMITDYIKKSEHKNAILERFSSLATGKARCQRLCVPFLTSAHLLLTRMTTDQWFHEPVAKFAWTACEKTSNPRKYMLACDIYCALALLGQLQLAMGFLYVLLGHRFPRVRTYTATQFYSVVLSLDCNQQDKIEEISNILQRTDWSDLSEAKRHRETVRSLIKAISSSDLIL